ncbi:MAG: hypothetical protein LBF22_03400, partial [Deltaproteobacteria bacterium]|nr:hypothetical protein [Deltaproteobacteria bacterium]
ALRENFKEDEIKIIFQRESELELSDEEIEEALNETIQEALKQISQKNYQGIVKVHAKKIISLAIAFFAKGPTLKTAFGPTYCQR